mmetsp:Transcript_29276/g.97285  ORF Transcript_29276/g.97285 Transcript_29276/m.97285 type:complete len:3836 (-) Transcript_29276:162-11669(-)
MQAWEEGLGARYPIASPPATSAASSAAGALDVPLVGAGAWVPRRGGQSAPFDDLGAGTREPIQEFPANPTDVRRASAHHGGGGAGNAAQRFGHSAIPPHVLQGYGNYAPRSRSSPLALWPMAIAPFEKDAQAPAGRAAASSGSLKKRPVGSPDDLHAVASGVQAHPDEVSVLISELQHAKLQQLRAAEAVRDAALAASQGDDLPRRAPSVGKLEPPSPNGSAQSQRPSRKQPSSAQRSPHRSSQRSLETYDPEGKHRLAVVTDERALARARLSPAQPESRISEMPSSHDSMDADDEQAKANLLARSRLAGTWLLDPPAEQSRAHAWDDRQVVAMQSFEYRAGMMTAPTVGVAWSHSGPIGTQQWTSRGAPESMNLRMALAELSELKDRLEYTQEEHLRAKAQSEQRALFVKHLTAEFRQEVQKMRTQAGQEVQQGQIQMATANHEVAVLRKCLYEQELEAEQALHSAESTERALQNPAVRQVLDQQLSSCRSEVSEDAQRRLSAEAAGAQQQIAQLREQLLQQRVALVQAQHDAGSQRLQQEVRSLAAQLEQSRRAEVDEAQCASRYAGGAAWQREEEATLRSELGNMRASAAQDALEHQANVAAAWMDVSTLREDLELQRQSLVEEAIQASVGNVEEMDIELLHETYAHSEQLAAGKVAAAWNHIEQLRLELSHFQACRDVAEEREECENQHKQKAKKQVSELRSELEQLNLANLQKAQRSERSACGARGEICKLQEQVQSHMSENARQGKLSKQAYMAAQGEVNMLQERLKAEEGGLRREAQAYREAMTEVRSLKNDYSWEASASEALVQEQHATFQKLETAEHASSDARHTLKCLQASVEHVEQRSLRAAEESREQQVGAEAEICELERSLDTIGAELIDFEDLKAELANFQVALESARNEEAEEARAATARRQEACEMMENSERQEVALASAECSAKMARKESLELEWMLNLQRGSSSHGEEQVAQWRDEADVQRVPSEQSEHRMVELENLLHEQRMRTADECEAHELHAQAAERLAVQAEAEIEVLTHEVQSLWMLLSRCEADAAEHEHDEARVRAEVAEHEAAVVRSSSENAQERQVVLRLNDAARRAAEEVHALQLELTSVAADRVRQERSLFEEAQVAARQAAQEISALRREVISATAESAQLESVISEELQSAVARTGDEEAWLWAEVGRLRRSLFEEASGAELNAQQAREQADAMADLCEEIASVRESAAEGAQRSEQEAAAAWKTVAELDADLDVACKAEEVMSAEIEQLESLMQKDFEESRALQVQSSTVQRELLGCRSEVQEAREFAEDFEARLCHEETRQKLELDTEVDEIRRNAMDEASQGHALAADMRHKIAEFVDQATHQKRTLSDELWAQEARAVDAEAEGTALAQQLQALHRGTRERRVAMKWWHLAKQCEILNMSTACEKARAEHMALVERLDGQERHLRAQLEQQRSSLAGGALQQEESAARANAEIMHQHQEIQRLMNLAGDERQHYNIQIRGLEDDVLQLKSSEERACKALIVELDQAHAQTVIVESSLLELDHRLQTEEELRSESMRITKLQAARSEGEHAALVAQVSALQTAHDDACQMLQHRGSAVHAECVQLQREMQQLRKSMQQEQRQQSFLIEEEREVAAEHEASLCWRDVELDAHKASVATASGETLQLVAELVRFREEVGQESGVAKRLEVERRRLGEELVERHQAAESISTQHAKEEQRIHEQRLSALAAAAAEAHGLRGEVGAFDAQLREEARGASVSEALAREQAEVISELCGQLSAVRERAHHAAERADEEQKSVENHCEELQLLFSQEETHATVRWRREAQEAQEAVEEFEVCLSTETQQEKDAWAFEVRDLHEEVLHEASVGRTTVLEMRRSIAALVDESAQKTASLICAWRHEESRASEFAASARDLRAELAVTEASVQHAAVSARRQQADESNELVRAHAEHTFFLSKFRDESSMLTGQLQAWKATGAEEAEQHQAAVAHAQVEIAKLSARCEQLQQSYSDSEEGSARKACGLEQQVSTLLSEMQDFEEQAKAQSAASEASLTTLEMQLQLEVAARCQDSQRSSVRAVSAEREEAGLLAELDRLRHTHSEMVQLAEVDKSSNQATIASLQGKLHSARTELAEGQEGVEEEISRRLQLKRELRQQEEELAKCREVIVDLEEQQDDAVRRHSELDELRSRSAEDARLAWEQRSVTLSELKHLKGEFCEAQGKVAMAVETMRDVDEAQISAAEAQFEISSLQHQLKTHEALLSHEVDKLSNLALRKDELESQLHAQEASHTHQLGGLFEELVAQRHACSTLTGQLQDAESNSEQELALLGTQVEGYRSKHAHGMQRIHPVAVAGRRAHDEMVELRDEFMQMGQNAEDEARAHDEMQCNFHDEIAGLELEIRHGRAAHESAIEKTEQDLRRNDANIASVIDEVAELKSNLEQQNAKLEHTLRRKAEEARNNAVERELCLQMRLSEVGRAEHVEGVARRAEQAALQNGLELERHVQLHAAEVKHFELQVRASEDEAAQSAAGVKHFQEMYNSEAFLAAHAESICRSTKQEADRNHSDMEHYLQMYTAEASHSERTKSLLHRTEAEWSLHYLSTEQNLDTYNSEVDLAKRFEVAELFEEKQVAELGLEHDWYISMYNSELASCARAETLAHEAQDGAAEIGFERDRYLIMYKTECARTECFESVAHEVEDKVSQMSRHIEVADFEAAEQRRDESARGIILRGEIVELGGKLENAETTQANHAQRHGAQVQAAAVETARLLARIEELQLVGAEADGTQRRNATKWQGRFEQLGQEIEEARRAAAADAADHVAAMAVVSHQLRQADLEKKHEEERASESRDEVADLHHKWEDAEEVHAALLTSGGLSAEATRSEMSALRSRVQQLQQGHSLAAQLSTQSAAVAQEEANRFSEELSRSRETAAVELQQSQAEASESWVELATARQLLEENRELAAIERQRCDALVSESRQEARRHVADAQEHRDQHAAQVAEASRLGRVLAEVHAVAAAAEQREHTQVAAALQQVSTTVEELEQARQTKQLCQKLADTLREEVHTWQSEVKLTRASFGAELQDGRDRLAEACEEILSLSEHVCRQDARLAEQVEQTEAARREAKVEAEEHAREAELTREGQDAETRRVRRRASEAQQSMAEMSELREDVGQMRSELFQKENRTLREELEQQRQRERSTRSLLVELSEQLMQRSTVAQACEEASAEAKAKAERKSLVEEVEQFLCDRIEEAQRNNPNTTSPMVIVGTPPDRKPRLSQVDGSRTLLGPNAATPPTPRAVGVSPRGAMIAAVAAAAIAAADGEELPLDLQEALTSPDGKIRSGRTSLILTSQGGETLDTALTPRTEPLPRSPIACFGNTVPLDPTTPPPSRFPASRSPRVSLIGIGQGSGGTTVPLYPTTPPPPYAPASRSPRVSSSGTGQGSGSSTTVFGEVSGLPSTPRIHRTSGTLSLDSGSSASAQLDVSMHRTPPDPTTPPPARMPSPRRRMSIGGASQGNDPSVHAVGHLAAEQLVAEGWAMSSGGGPQGGAARSRTLPEPTTPPPSRTPTLLSPLRTFFQGVSAGHDALAQGLVFSSAVGTSQAVPSSSSSSIGASVRQQSELVALPSFPASSAAAPQAPSESKVLAVQSPAAIPGTALQPLVFAQGTVQESPGVLQGAPLQSQVAGQGATRLSPAASHFTLQSPGALQSAQQSPASLEFPPVRWVRRKSGGGDGASRSTGSLGSGIGGAASLAAGVGVGSDGIGEQEGVGGYTLGGSSVARSSWRQRAAPSEPVVAGGTAGSVADRARRFSEGMVAFRTEDPRLGMLAGSSSGGIAQPGGSDVENASEALAGRKSVGREG